MNEQVTEKGQPMNDCKQKDWKVPSAHMLCSLTALMIN